MEASGNAVNSEETPQKPADEKELQDKIAQLQNALAQEKSKSESLQQQLQERTDEREHLKIHAGKLEKELAKYSLQTNGTDEMVTQAKGVIFEKTKMCKNQELQIDALTQQVASLKEIVAISKDMLEIRNLEAKELTDKLSCFELKFTVEKDRTALVHAKLERMIVLHETLKNEYEKQLKLFTDLQRAYKSKENSSHPDKPVNDNKTDA